MNTTLESVKSQMKVEDSDLLGTQVFWTLSESSEIQYSAIVDMVKASGLGEEMAKPHTEGGILPNRVTPCSAWTRAVADFKKSDYVKNHNLHVEHSHVTAVEKGDPSFGLLTVHERNVDGKGAKVNFNQKRAYEFNKDAQKTQDGSEVISAMHSVSGSDHIFNQLVDLYNRAMNVVNVNDIREMIKRALKKAQAFAMRPRGGIYFVHSSQREYVTAIEEVVEYLPGSSIYTLDLPKNSSRNVSTVKATAVEALRQELYLLGKNFQENLDSVKRNKSGSISSGYHTLVDSINEFSSKADFLQNMLEVEISEISNRVRKYKTILQKKMTEI